jgi:hypothetical protein
VLDRSSGGKKMTLQRKSFVLSQEEVEIEEEADER